MTTTKTTPSVSTGTRPTEVGKLRIKGVPLDIAALYLKGWLRPITLPDHCPEPGEPKIAERPLGMDILTRVWVGNRCIVSDYYYSFNDKEEYFYHIQDWLRISHFIHIRYKDELIIHSCHNKIRDIPIKSSILEKLFDK